jgi:hypothetical protein
MPQAGTTSDLYIDPADSSSTLGQPPAAPSSVPDPAPAPVVAAQPVPTQVRMADQNADGSVRDTSGAAVNDPSRDLHFRNVDDEDQVRRAAEARAKKEADEKAAQAAAPPATSTSTAAPAPNAAPEKLYAGKFKSAEELEKGYQEAQAAMTRAQQERAELEKRLQATPPAPPKTAAQLAADEAAEKQAFLEKFASDPQGVLREYQQNAVRQTEVALSSQKMREDWLRDNPDLAAAPEHEVLVGMLGWHLASSDPALAANPKALLDKATGTYREMTGKIRSEAAKEALTTQTRVTPLLSNTAPAPTTGQPPKAPLSGDAAFNEHMAMLRNEQSRTRHGLRH